MKKCLTNNRRCNIIVIESEVRKMKDENFNPCENCPYDDNGWCCCKDNLPNDALCYMEENEND